MGCGEMGYGLRKCEPKRRYGLWGEGLRAKVYGASGLRGRYGPWGGGSRLWAWAMGCGASG
jgi:hypothetical protein